MGADARSGRLSRSCPMSDKETDSQQNNLGPDSKMTGRIAVNDSIDILLDRPLPQLNKAGVRVFAAEGTGRATKDLIAYVCDDTLTPRLSFVENYGSVVNPNLARLVDARPVYWQPDSRKHFVFIYEHNLGKPLVANDAQAALGLKADLILSNIVRPILSALTDIRNQDMVHGEIRLGNIFDGNSENYERLILGECLSLPPSYAMPAVYETAERAQADPAGRGNGTIEDDLYSFGVCLAMMLRHNDPTEGMSDDDIIASKYEQSSYITIMGRERYSGHVVELIRGLLQDDPVQRWTIEEINNWLDGQRQSPKPGTKRLKARRPLDFNHEKYILPEILAKDLHKNVSHAVQIVQNGEVEQWIVRAIDDKRLEERFFKIQDRLEESDSKIGYDDKIVSLHAILFNTKAPVYYDGLKIMPPGFGTALTEAYLTKNLGRFVALLNSRIMVEWLDAQESERADLAGLFGKIDSCRVYLRQKQVGFGLERCLYILNPDSYCLSDKVKDYYVRSPEEMMVALEELSHTSNRPVHLFDPHIIAFLSVKERQNIDPYFFELNHEMPAQRIMGELKTLATIQKRSRLGNFPGIAAWVDSRLTPVYERIHDRDLRRRLEAMIAGPVKKGDLGKMAAMLDDTRMHKADFHGFRLAMNEYQLLARESTNLDYRLENDKRFGEDTGRLVAGAISCGLSLLLILLSAYITFFEAGEAF